MSLTYNELTNKQTALILLHVLTELRSRKIPVALNPYE